MSQEKVDRNKAAKANRKKDMQSSPPSVYALSHCVQLSPAGVVIPFIRDRLLIRLLRRLKWMLPHLQITRIR